MPDPNLYLGTVGTVGEETVLISWEDFIPASESLQARLSDPC